MKRGQKITYVRTYAFGKTSKETATVVAIKGRTVLLDNGDELMMV